MSDARTTPPSFDEMVLIIENNFKDFLKQSHAFTANEIEEGWQRYKTLNHLYQDESPAEQPGREVEAVEFHDWVEKNRWEIDHREQHTHTTAELYKLFKEEKEAKP